MIDRLPVEVQALTYWLKARIDLARHDERGESVVQWVIIVAIVAALAIAVGAIIVSQGHGQGEQHQPQQATAADPARAR